jgi:hypothetical protein
MSIRPEDTADEWQRLLYLCVHHVYAGHGALDSFLCGPDLDRRVQLVIAEARTNETLQLELRDTLTAQTEWSAEQHTLLRVAAQGSMS